MPNITNILKTDLKTNIVKSILFEIITNTSRYFYTFGRTVQWPTVVDTRNANIFTVERSNNIVRITTKTPHNLVKNDKIIVAATNLTQINNPPSTTPNTITTIGRVADIVTVTTLAPHGFTLDDTVEINTNLDDVDGVFPVQEVVSQDTFRYYLPGNNFSDISDLDDIDGTVQIFTPFVVLDVLNSLTFTYEKAGNNITSIAEEGKVFSVSRDVISSETDPPSVSDSYPYELEVRNEMLFMKLIDSNDVSIVIPRINWQPGITYDMYDEYSGDRLSYSGASSLTTSKFYVLTDEFNVYKCIFNNNDNPSSVKPTSLSPTSEELTLSDGYIWKFMYTIPLSLRNKFLTSDYMPVLSALSNQFYSNGSITSYSIVSSGNGYIRNTYSLKAINVKAAGSGYLQQNLETNVFKINISSIERSNNLMTISLSSAHGLPLNSRGGAILISPSVDQIIVGSDTIELNLLLVNSSNPATHVIYDVPSSTSIVIENPGADLANTVITGYIQLTGAIIEFPVAETPGVQTKAYVSQYGPGGSIEVISILESGSGYYIPPLPTITMLNGLTATSEVDYYIEHESNKDNGYTEVIVDGDGYNAYNPFSLKRVIINEGNRGIFAAPISGDIFTFPEPDLNVDQGRKPIVTVNFRIAFREYPITLSGRNIGNNGFIVLELPQTEDLLYTIGSTIEISGSTFESGLYNGTQTITNIVSIPGQDEDPTTHIIFFESIGTPTDEPFSEPSALVINSSGEIGYEVDDVVVVDSGYGYSKPFIFGDDSTGNYFSVYANDLTLGGFSCSLDENNQKNSAALIPIINNGRIESLQILFPGIGYSYANIIINGYKKDGSSLVLMNPENTEGFEYANIQTRFSVGDIESKQSTVELFAKEGSISCVKVDASGQNYGPETRVVILGDGSGAVAEPVIVNGRITRVRLINPGVGYTTATAYLSGAALNNDPLSITPINNGVGASIRVILAPKGGHGKDAIAELYGRSIYFTSRLSNEKNRGIVTIVGSEETELRNDYRQITILKNPYGFNRSEFYSRNLGSSCILVSSDVDDAGQNINSVGFTQFQQDDVLLVETLLGAKRFILVEKQIIADKYYLVLQPIDNYYPEVNSYITKQSGSNSYSMIIISVDYPEFNKFSGDMLYISNRTSFTPSNEQSVVISTLINF